MNEVHRISVEPDRVREELPVPEVSGEHENSARRDDALRLAVPELGVVERHAFGDVRRRQPLHVAPFGGDAPEVATRLAEDGQPLVIRLLGKCDAQVHHGGLALRPGQHVGDVAEVLAEPERGLEPQAPEESDRQGEGGELDPGGER